MGVFNVTTGPRVARVKWNTFVDRFPAKSDAVNVMVCAPSAEPSVGNCGVNIMFPSASTGTGNVVPLSVFAVTISTPETKSRTRPATDVLTFVLGPSTVTTVNFGAIVSCARLNTSITRVATFRPSC